jgi:hypothetical protein
MGFAIVHGVNRTVFPIALSLAATAGLGLLSGFVVRWTLPSRASLRRMLASLAALTVGLLTLGLMTRGQAGVGPLSPPFVTINWLGLGHIALAAFAAWLALQAWQPKHTGLSLADRWRARWEASALHREIARGREWLARARAWMDSLQPPTSASAPASRARVRVHAARPRRLGWNVLDRVREILNRRDEAARHRRVRPRPARYASPVRFIGLEEHRCPYCLELVEPNDPRGVEVCAICHTRHHADCWAVTGVCQVPHHRLEAR